MNYKIDTTQLFLDVYSDRDETYVRPLKVWNRYSETMFMPHAYDRASGEFFPLSDGVQISHFYEIMNTQQAASDDQNMDSWDRFFNLSRQMYQQGMDITAACNRMCNIMITRDEKLRVLVKENFKP